MSAPTRPTSIDVEAARKLYEDAENEHTAHFDRCRSKGYRWCRACGDLDRAARAAFKAYRTAVHIEAGLPSPGPSKGEARQQANRGRAAKATDAI
jgi:hypothetical protein